MKENETPSQPRLIDQGERGWVLNPDSPKSEDIGSKPQTEASAKTGGTGVFSKEELKEMEEAGVFNDSPHSDRGY